MNSIYLERYAWKERLFPTYTADPELSHIIVIPAFKEKKLSEALDSINNCEDPKGKVLILVVINESEDADKETITINRSCLEELKDYQSNYQILFSHIKLPAKKAGVGLARKIGMDEAVRIFNSINQDGTIICYDADCRCDPDYLTTIEKHFDNAATLAGVVFYEHQLNGPNHEAILSYELYLRYYIDALRFAGYPFAHQTLGSCIIVRCSHYQLQGGMNTRKAGEDFYFLNKIIQLGGFVEINTTTVRPSDRVSDRVPFGTGKAIGQLLESEDSYTVYNPRSFEDLKKFIGNLSTFWQNEVVEIPETILEFYEGKVLDEIDRIKTQTTTLSTFTQRFFRWFDAFKILKFIHFARDRYYPNVPLADAVNWLGNSFEIKLPEDEEQKLVHLRAFDRKWIRLSQTGP
ncbi:MAG: glycosyltransferase family A protein [Cyclobacteriaceae bacterium]